MLTQDQIEEILKPWTAQHQMAALLEGWDLFTATDGSPVQVQRIDAREEVPEGGTYLINDTVAMMKVRCGTGPHHSVARKILADHFPEEWKLVNEAHDKLAGG